MELAVVGVDADAAIRARIGRALINIVAAVGSIPSHFTGAQKLVQTYRRVNGRLRADAVHTRCTFTFVGVSIAVRAVQPRVAVAEKSVHRQLRRAATGARKHSGKRTLTQISLEARERLIADTVCARMTQTLVDIVGAVFA